ncbi:MAG: SRPBCC domain-containing protein [Roseibium sp.]|nr:SRPBCC domain-containing protein [Roseibium sp.]
MTTEDACHFEVLLPIARQAAFALVVDKPFLWWSSPFEPGDDPKRGVAEVEIEPQPGGLCHEIGADGVRRVWGTVLSIEYPLYLRLAWQVSPDKTLITDPAAASRVMMTFRDAGTMSRLEVDHTEFVRHGEGGQTYRSLMNGPGGWPRLLDNIVAVAGAKDRRS